MSVSSLLAHLPEPIGPRADLFIEGARATLALTGVAGVSGLVVGLALGLGKLSTAAWLRWPASAIVALLRGTPLLVQILFAYYGLPALVPQLELSEFSAAAMALAFNVGAYNAEVVRAGILAVPRGQIEAGLSLGFTHLQTLRLVVVPQAFRITLPPLVNNLVALLKDSSLASSIGLLELTLAGNRISSETFRPVPVLTTIAVIYLIQTSAVTGLAHLLERKLRIPGT